MSTQVQPAIQIPSCDHCGLANPAMVAMEPGRDRKEWWLCGSCWIEGRTPMKLGRVKVTEIADPKLYDALVSASKRTPGLIEMPPDAAPAAKKPRARRSR